MLSQQLKKPDLSLILVVVIGISLSFFAFYNVKQWEREQALYAKQQEADKYVRALRQNYNSLRDIFRSIKSLYELNHQFSAQTFRDFVKRYLQNNNYQGLEALAWVPAISATALTGFEQQMQAEFLTDFNVWQFCATDNPCPLEQRDTYYPIQFIELIERHRILLGLDLGASQLLRKSFFKARDDGLLTLSAPVLQQAPSGLYMIFPLYRYEYDEEPPTVVARRSTLMGFIVGLFHTNSYLEETLRPPRYNTTIFLQLFDETEPEKPILLYQPEWLERKPELQEKAYEVLPEVPITLDFGGRQWRVALYHIPSFFEFEHWYSVSILCLGLFFTLGVWRYLLVTLNRASWAEILVTQRTKSLQETNMALQQEMETTRQVTLQLDASRRQFRAIFDEAGMGIVQTNLDGMILENNKAVQAIIGYGVQELHGRILNDFAHPVDADSDQALLAGLLHGNYDSYRIGKRYLCRNGETVWTHVNCSIVRDPNNPFLISMIEDVTERHFAEIARLEAERKYRKIFENAIEGIFQCTMTGRFLSVNPAFLKIFGCKNDSLLYENNSDVKYYLHEDPERYEAFLHLLASQREVQNFEYRARCFDGRSIWVAETVRIVHDEHGNLSFYEGFIEDITDRKVVEEQLRYDATHDQLTGLLNRHAFTRHLERALAKLHQTGIQNENSLPFVVLFVDLDRFKIVNDSMGHLVGDQLLEEVAHRLRREARGCDIVARFGGDEFALMLENVSSIKSLEYFIEHLNKYLSDPYLIQNETFNTTASIGIAIASLDYSSADEILRDSDIAMYEAKKQGRGKAVFFQPGMHVQVLNIMRMESDLRKAFEREEFCLFYQPIISLENRHTVSVEALLRWQHPEKGLIPPDRFIPLAEDTGLIRELGLWVLETSCRQLREWQILFPHHQQLGMNINVSAVQLKQPRLVRQVQDIIDRTGVKPQSCRMEITESAMMNDPDLMLNVLLDLKGLEVQLYIDDFGTGYSSLSYLQKFPIDALKIDKSFIQNIDASNKSMQIAQAIIALGNAFDLRVVAEGVETLTQLDILQASHCHHVQGYYFSRPTDVATTENYLSILVH